MAVEFRVLGPVEVWRDGAQVPLTAAKQRALLALGLLEAGRVVSVPRLVDAVWGAYLRRCTTSGGTIPVLVLPLVEKWH